MYALIMMVRTVVHAISVEGFHGMDMCLGERWQAKNATIKRNRVTPVGFLLEETIAMGGLAAH